MSQWTRDERVSANDSKCRTPAWATYCARDGPLAASSPADGARICRRRVKAAFSCAERSAACRFRPGRPAMSFDRQSDRTWHRRLARAFGRHFPVNITSTCQARRLGIQSNSHVRLDAAARHLRMRPAHDCRIARMPGMCRNVALATDHERDAAPNRDIHGDWRFFAAPIRDSTREIRYS